MKQSLIILAIAFCALAAGIYVNQLTDNQSRVDTPALPDFSFPDLAGRTHSLTEWHGKIIVVNFWATWCPPCRKEIPEFVELQKEYGEQGLQFVGIALEEKETVAAYLNTLETNYPMLIGGDQAMALAQQMGNIAGILPFSLVFNRDGQLIHRQAGPFSKEDLIKLIKPLL
ncbi:TlpA family protein disulfide reductase [Methylicorpusculum oleiharenae]|uniref:TlpA family protein disulfide reductase n=1 Tax=Methylicorpusculum oleiharenae TaxID=1338687 RepID=UPI00135C1DD2|nr:TlpA disulfide reductase family protein [Methylicorpusculum oleiharenae]MCD2450679.1 TlpA family protein disulfide reductase [Methylicorpusculum oleiharenae]